MSLKKISLKSKLIFALSVIASLTVLTSFTAILLFSEIKYEINELTNSDIVSLQQILKISDSLSNIGTTLETIRTNYRIQENNGNVIKLKNSWHELSREIADLEKNNSKLSLEISHHKIEISQLTEQLPNLSQVLFDLMEARLTSTYIHKDVLNQQVSLHEKLSTEVRIAHKDHMRVTYESNKKEHLNIMNNLIDFYDKSSELSTILLSSFDESTIKNLNSMGRKSLQLHNLLSNKTQIFPPNALIFTKSWLQQIRRLVVGDTSIFTIRRTEKRLIKIIDTLLNQHIILAEKIESDSKSIANTLYKKVNISSNELTHKLIFYNNVLVIIPIICLILVFLIIWLYLGRKIFRPIEKIRRAMVKISNGNIDAALPEAQDNEIGDMVLALSKLKEHVSAVTNIAQYDGLTNLLNRREFDITLDKEIRRCKREKTPISLLLCDIDFFKKYNDNYGHIAGDNCLVICTKEIGSLFNRITDSCFRYGGEEFAAIMVGLEPLEAYEMAEKLRHKIEDLRLEHKYSDCSKVVTISVGIIHCEAQHLSSPQVLLMKVDAMLYKAKGNGRNRVESTSI